MAVPATGFAEESVEPVGEHCARIRARARSESSLLYSPSLHVQALRVPVQGDLSNASLMDGHSQEQIRVYASYSFLDAYRAHLTMRVAHAECGARDEQLQLREALEVAAVLGEVDALRRRLASLDSSRSARRQIQASAKRRLERGVSTMLEHHEVVSLVLHLERARIRTRAEIARLEAALSGSEADEAPPSLDRRVRRYVQSTMDFERAASTLRRSSAWDFSVSAGVVPAPVRDYFGMVHVSYNLGDLAQASAEADYLDARRRELEGARYELAHLAKRTEKELARSTQALGEELSLVESELQMLDEQLRALEASEVEAREHFLAVARLRAMDLNASAAYLEELLRQRSRWANTEGHAGVQSSPARGVGDGT